MSNVKTFTGKKMPLLKAILYGLDGDLSLFMPENFYQLTEEDYKKMQGMSFAERLAYILYFYLQDELDFKTLQADCLAAMQTFSMQDCLPVVKLDKSLFIAELFYGQTHCFYDFANALFPFLYRHAYAKYGENKKPLAFLAANINSACAVAQSMQSCNLLQTTILYPAAFCSKLQKIEIANKRQQNITILPVNASDLEDVEEILLQFLQKNRGVFEEQGYCITVLGEWNILNTLVTAAIFISSYVDVLSVKELGKIQNIDFVLPLEDFSLLTAICYAKNMNLPIQNSIIGCNVNAAIIKGLQQLSMTKQDATLTISPAMDSNTPYTLFKLLFALDDSCIAKQGQAFLQQQAFTLTALQKQWLNKNLYFLAAKEENQIDCIYNFFEEYSYLLDTHTACGEFAYQTLLENRELANSTRLLFATTNPFKYPQDTMYAITGEDINDSFKAIKHLELSSAMQATKSLKKLRTMQVEIATFSIEEVKNKLLQSINKKE